MQYLINLITDISFGMMQASGSSIPDRLTTFTAGKNEAIRGICLQQMVQERVKSIPDEVYVGTVNVSSDRVEAIFSVTKRITVLHEDMNNVKSIDLLGRSAAVKAHS